MMKIKMNKKIIACTLTAFITLFAMANSVTASTFDSWAANADLVLECVAPGEPLPAEEEIPVNAISPQAYSGVSVQNLSTAQSGSSIGSFGVPMVGSPAASMASRSLGATSALFSAAAGTNDDPNYAILLALNAGYEQMITPVGASRWFATQITAPSKLTTILDMPSSADFDVYVYKLNGSSLNPVASSNITGNGVREVSQYIGTAGYYYFRVIAYSGTGMFQLYNLASGNIDAYEMNDSANTATSVQASSTQTVITGNIDNPYDTDYYLITFPYDRAIFAATITVAGKDYVVQSNGETLTSGYPYNIEAPAGYPNVGVILQVRSPGHAYDDTVSYTLRINQPIGFDPDLDEVLTSVDNKVTVQVPKMPNGSYTYNTLYVNGHLIDWDYNWIYQHTVQGAGGSGYNTRVSATPQAGQIPILNDLAAASHTPPNVIRLCTYTSTAPDHGKQFTTMNNALYIGVSGIKVRNVRIPSGLYTSNWDSTIFQGVLIIDPENGHVYDVISPNLYYDNTSDHATVMLINNSILHIGNQYW